VVLRLIGLETLGQVAFHANTLRRVVLNLVQNALDAMPQGGTLTLAGQGTATQVQLHVRDTGSGIPATRLEQIFEPLSLQRHFSVLTKFAHVESRLSGRKRQREMLF
jgi:signal transduction histidine kinase